MCEIPNHLDVRMGLFVLLLILYQHQEYFQDWFLNQVLSHRRVTEHCFARDLI